MDKELAARWSDAVAKLPLVAILRGIAPEEAATVGDVLWTAGRDINRVTYHLHAWDRAPRRL